MSTRSKSGSQGRLDDGIPEWVHETSNVDIESEIADSEDEDSLGVSFKTLATSLTSMTSSASRKSAKSASRIVVHQEDDDDQPVSTSMRLVSLPQPDSYAPQSSSASATTTTTSLCWCWRHHKCLDWMTLWIDGLLCLALSAYTVLVHVNMRDAHVHSRPSVFVWRQDAVWNCMFALIAIAVLSLVRCISCARLYFWGRRQHQSARYQLIRDSQVSPPFLALYLRSAVSWILCLLYGVSGLLIWYNRKTWSYKLRSITDSSSSSSPSALLIALFVPAVQDTGVAQDSADAQEYKFDDVFWPLSVSTLHLMGRHYHFLYLALFITAGLSCLQALVFAYERACILYDYYSEDDLPFHSLDNGAYVGAGPGRSSWYSPWWWSHNRQDNVANGISSHGTNGSGMSGPHHATELTRSLLNIRRGEPVWTRSPPPRRQRRRERWLWRSDQSDQGDDNGQDLSVVDPELAVVQQEWRSRSQHDPLWWTREDGETARHNGFRDHHDQSRQASAHGRRPPDISWLDDTQSL
jgi:hypothetical protein